MTFDPTSHLKTAADLLTLSEGEPDAERHYRSIANRAYYATYGLVRKRLELLNSTLFGKHGRHAPLIDSMVESQDAHVANVGTRLNRLKVLREKADYEFDAGGVSLTDAQTALSASTKAIERATALQDAQLRRIATTMLKKLTGPYRHASRT